jgi:lipoprotein-anchoring transpeptidase ErfK/SrfK
MGTAAVEGRIKAKLSKSARNVLRNIALTILALLVARVAGTAQQTVEPSASAAQPRTSVPNESGGSNVLATDNTNENRAPVETEVAGEPQREIIVSVTDRKLALLEDGEVIKIYSVAVGKSSTPSPSGDFQIINRLTDPTYYHPHVVIGPGPQNPLGTRWIGLNKKGFGIHGTNEPGSIGKAASHGCIRMAKADLEELFALVRSGDSVSIRGERDEEVAEIFGSEEAVTVADATATTAPPIAATGNK